MLLSACAGPLGPGFKIEKQAFEVRLFGASSPRLAVRAAYTLKNTGTNELAFVEATLPDERTTGRENVRVRMEGREIPASTLGGIIGRALRIPCDPPWMRRQKRNIEIEYDLAPAAPGQVAIAVDDASFRLLSPNGFPELRAPHSPLGELGGPPENTRLTVIAPAAFHVLAAGRERGTHEVAGGMEHRFELRKADGEPFIVGGRYVEAQYETPAGKVVFWTFEPLDPEHARPAAARIASTWKMYQEVFGKLEDGNRPPLVAEASTGQLSPAGSVDQDAPAGAVFPGGVVLSGAAFSLGVASEAFLHMVERELARIWFGVRITPRPEAELVLGEGAVEYATVVAAEAREGEAARRREVAMLLRRYDEARAKVAEKPLVPADSATLEEQRAFGRTKGALFFLVLEDQFGKENVRRTLAHLVRSLHPDDVGVNDLRAAIELETKHDLAGFFRTWLFQTGIPDDFRSRYAGVGKAAPFLSRRLRPNFSGKGQAGRGQSSPRSRAVAQSFVRN